MTKQGLPKKNHYVPQFYLRGFSIDEERVFRLDKHSNAIKHLPIKVVGFQKNLYTYQTIDGETKSLEDIFAQMEGLAAHSIKLLRAGKALSPQERADLSYFLGFLMVRTPAFQNKLLSSQEELTEKVMRMRMKMTPPEHIQKFFEERGKTMTKEDAQDMIDFGSDEKRSKLVMKFPQGYWIKQMLQLANDMYPIFEICDWEIKHSPTPFGFLTSDHPFLLIPGEKPDPFDGVGLLTPQAKKVIPLAADICLIAHEPCKKPTIIHAETDKDFFRKVNRWTIKNAEVYVFSPSKGKVEKMVKKNINLLKTPKRYRVS